MVVLPVVVGVERDDDAVDDAVELGVLGGGDPVPVADRFGDLAVGNVAQRDRDDPLVQRLGVRELLAAEPGCDGIGGDDEQHRVARFDRAA